MRLSGYGVQLSIKSTEYKAVDDTQVQEGTFVTSLCVLPPEVPLVFAAGDAQAASQVASQEDEEEDISGFLFKTLK